MGEKISSKHDVAGRKLIYQIYPTAIGDLRDIKDALPLIAKLKPDYIWLNPIFVSPWVDGGYDVADYCKIDPRFGTMADFKRLVTEAKKYNIGILLDLVLNHTSNQHPWFQKSIMHDSWYKDYYVWLDKPLNWNSFFGGPAFDYEARRGEYYLHLYDQSQPDLNFKNPRVVREFKNIIKFWKDQGVAGFRVDSANILTERNLKHGMIPRLSGFFSYYQPKDTVQILDKLLAQEDLFTIAEPVGGNYMSKKTFRGLTQNAFNAAFNIGTLDVADTYMSNKERIRPINYKRWLTKLADWSQEPKFSLALESHDTPRAVSRFNANPKALCMLEFCLPGNYPCIYQGQELGTKNAHLSNNIDDYPGVQSRMIYRHLRREGKTKKEAMRIVKHTSRDNARQPIDWGDYLLQSKNPASVLGFYYQMLEIWRNDPVMADGKLKVRYIGAQGVMNFNRVLGDRSYFIHIDLTGKTSSYLRNDKGEKILQTR